MKKMDNGCHLSFFFKKNKIGILLHFGWYNTITIKTIGRSVMVTVQGKTLDEVWFKTLVALCEHGRVYRITSGSYAGDVRLEFDKLSGVIESVFVSNSAGTDYLPLAPTVPDGCPVPTTDKKIEEYFQDYIIYKEEPVRFGDIEKWKKFAWRGVLYIKSGFSAINMANNRHEDINDNEKVYLYNEQCHYRYATFIRGGVYRLPGTYYVMMVPDQMEWILNHYKTNGFGNNHCCMVIGYPESNMAYDEEFENETERNTSPCLRLIDTKIVNGKLNFEVYFRSWDLYSGMPENLGGLAWLQRYMASELGIESGVLGFTSIKAHVYGHSILPLMLRTGNYDVAEKVKSYIEKGK
jgi:thymidylate synthase